MDIRKSLISYFSGAISPRVIQAFSSKKHISLSGSSGYTSRIMTVADVLRHEKKHPQTVVWAVNTKAERDMFLYETRRWTGLPSYGLDLTHTTTWELQDIERVVPENQRADHVAMISFLSHFFTTTPKSLIIPAFYLTQQVPTPQQLTATALCYTVGMEAHTVAVFEQLIGAGYAVAPSFDDLARGEYVRSGDVVYIYPVNGDYVVRLDMGFDSIDGISFLDPSSRAEIARVDAVQIFSIIADDWTGSFLDYFNDRVLFVEDELDITDEMYEPWTKFAEQVRARAQTVVFTLFNEDTEAHQHLHFLSFLRYVDVYDFVNDLREKKTNGWNVLLFTKAKDEIFTILRDNTISFSDTIDEISPDNPVIYVVSLQGEDAFPFAFQNPEIKLAVITDREISILKEDKRRASSGQRVFFDLMSGLKVGDYVVHADHGIAMFLGLEQRKVDDITREYLKLGYAEGDKLFVPIDQADKVGKYIGSEESMPKLTRLGSVEWNTITSKVRKETEQIAEELLKLYAERKEAKAFRFAEDGRPMVLFEESFPYEETPGQIRAIVDVKRDMERDVPMDRLICGDVGFGKTEVAMRAAFKAVQSHKQAMIISPITILADQHFRTFKKRMDSFDIRVEMLSRFVSKKDQDQILRRLEKGEVDVVIGTHRLLQPDVKFKDLGLVVIDEEQRFGVKQKEALKAMKLNVHMLTLTATPIPRTLNISLNKLRDITTITTPPPGRLAVITEVRKFSLPLIREAVMREIQRGGQIYFLHNRVQTINSVADKLRALLPEARIIVAHGQLGSDALEERILAFKDHKYDILVSSAIIENGIDLPNANTLIVDQAEKFGLAQLYQLRGRVGRSRTQAYAYFLYHGQRLKLDAKRRLKAIVEASELGSGFQIAMKDLEIRGAGEILGAKQHGVINVVGVSHFIRMLNKAVEDLKSGRVERADEPLSVTVELPLTCFIPDSYIVSSKEKIGVYQRMASCDAFDDLEELKQDVVDDYGRMPKEVLNLFKVLELKLYAKRAGVVNVKAENVHMGKDKQVITLLLSKKVKPLNIANLLEYNSKWQISGSKLKLPMAEMGIGWIEELQGSLERLAKSISDVVKR